MFAGLLPWAKAPEGPFTRLRDQYLLDSPSGLAVSGFYYRWTLYPAESLKPLAARSQPTAATAPSLTPAERKRFCGQALRLGIICVPPNDPGADFRVANADSEINLTSAGYTSSWTQTSAAQKTAWLDFSRAVDPARPLRKATAVGLLVGCPLGLCWLLAAIATRLGSWFPGRWKTPASLLSAGAVASIFATASMPDPGLLETRRLLLAEPGPTAETVDLHSRSQRPVERFYAVQAARRLGAAGTPFLIEAVADPVINVRYAAARELGGTGDPRAKEVLLEILRSDDWYVKERAYTALWKLGWRPR
jgi:hypothetical protein